MSDLRAALTDMVNLSREIRASGTAGDVLTANMLDSMLKFLRETDPGRFDVPETGIEEAARRADELRAKGKSERSIRNRLRRMGLA